jgi:hypothetical protein
VTVRAFMSGLRDLVTGAGCSAGDGSASSSRANNNPVARFADSLLGGSSKATNGQLRELPGASDTARCTFARSGAQF